LNSLAAVIHVNKRNAAGNSEKVMYLCYNVCTTFQNQP